MAVIDIARVQASPTPATLRGFGLDKPATGTTRDVYDIEFAGWVLGDAVPAEAVEIHAEGQILRKVPLDQHRVDVANAFPDVEGAAVCGFRTWVNVVGLEPNVPLQIRAVLADGKRQRLGSVTYSHQPLITGYEPRLQPLMLTTLGRAGTTWTMRLLSEHPSIAIHRAHPYELRAARYWLHSFKILTEPRDPYRSAQADTFQNSRSWAGHNPFYPEPIGVTPGLGKWMGKTYVEEQAGAAQRWIDECYERIAAGQGMTNPIYFAEKHRADSLPWLVWEVYPRAKEIFLVRDFRDVITSMLSFNAKHNRQVFGPEHITTDEDFVRFLRRGTIRLLSTSWPKRQDRAHLIRYEDLIQDPVTVTRGMLEYLELEATDEIIDDMLERASTENPDMKRHLTSAAVSSSIGRWRTTLSPSVQAVCEEALTDVLQQFGYAD